MNIVATSDLHGHLPDIPACDLLLIGGDVCPTFDHKQEYQVKWLRSTFRDWLNSISCDNIVGIGGNHDFVLDSTDIGYELPWTYLQDETVEIDGLKIHGTPWSCKYGNWAFMKPDQELNDYWDKIPSDVDIILSHGPFYGYGDIIPMAGYEMGKGWFTKDEHVGSQTMANKIMYGAFPNLQAFICGHIHEGYGRYDPMPGLSVYNVSYVDVDYEPNNLPLPIKDWR